MHGFSERDTELQIGHLYGLRWFQICAREGEPEITAGNVVLRGAWGFWEPGENTAVCKRGHTPVMAPRREHEVPDRQCGCGFWAYWTLGKKQVSPPSVVAIVKGYGKTIEGDKGFRCSLARIIAICMPNYHAGAALILEEAYHVDVFSSLDAMLLLNPAPAEQVPLGDDYFRHRAGPVSLSNVAEMDLPSPSSASGGTVSGGGNGGRQIGESPLEYARRLGLAHPAVPCVQCHRPTARTGQARCANCEYDLIVAETKAKDAKLLGSQTDPAARLRQLHERREGWAK